MRLLACGSRAWLDERRPAEELERLRPSVLIHGAARGADVICADTMIRVACMLGWAVVVEPYPVDEAIDGPWPAAGVKRNARMMLARPHRGLALGRLWRFDHLKTRKWKHTGTGDMVARMLRARLPIRWIETPEAISVDLVKMPDHPHGYGVGVGE